jgi:KUP system potassium uptake protein
VFPHPKATTTPLALRANVDFSRILPERVILIEIVNENVPHIRHVDRVTVNDLGNVADGSVHMSVHVGFTDSQDIPKGLALAQANPPSWTSISTPCASSCRTDRARDRPPPAQKLAKTARRVDAPQRRQPHRGLPPPPDRTIVMGAKVEV